jgi:hypothetical protein
MDTPKRIRGFKAENYFISLLNEKGIPYQYVDEWYDFEVEGNKVEIKSCRLSVKHSNRKRKNQQYQVGRFDFTDFTNRDRQYEENIWICFIVRHEDQFILLGFTRAKKLNRQRYISIHRTRNFNLLDLDEWLGIINRDS